MSALGLGEEDAKSPGDSESFSARRPQKHVDHFSDAADRRGKYILIGEVEELHLHDIRESKRGLMEVNITPSHHTRAKWHSEAMFSRTQWQNITRCNSDQWPLQPKGERKRSVAWNRHTKTETRHSQKSESGNGKKVFWGHCHFKRMTVFKR